MLELGCGFGAASLLVALDAAGEAWVEYPLPADAQRHVLHIGQRFHRALLTFDKGAAAFQRRRHGLSAYRPRGWR
jgi:hypothetical protein